MANAGAQEIGSAKPEHMMRSLSIAKSAIS